MTTGRYFDHNAVTPQGTTDHMNAHTHPDGSIQYHAHPQGTTDPATVADVNTALNAENVRLRSELERKDEALNAIIRAGCDCHPVKRGADPDDPESHGLLCAVRRALAALSTPKEER